MKKSLSLILGIIMCLSLFAACGTPAAEPTPTQTPEPTLSGTELAAHYKQAIEAARDDETNEYNSVATTDEEMGSITWEVLGITADQLDAYAVSISLMNVSAYCVALFKPLEGQEEAVMTALQAYIDGVEQSFTNYLPDQLVIAQNAILEQLDDGTIALVMCDNQDTVRDAIVAAL